MVEKLGRWYVFSSGESKYPSYFKIHEEYVKNGIISLNIDGMGQSEINIFNIKYINGYYVSRAGVKDISNIITFNDGATKYVKARYQNEIESLSEHDYKFLLDIENLTQRNKKLEQQVEKLTAHVLALMINNGNLDVEYGGEFP